MPPPPLSPLPTWMHQSNLIQTQTLLIVKTLNLLPLTRLFPPIISTHLSKTQPRFFFDKDGHLHCSPSLAHKATIHGPSTGYKGYN